MEFSARFGLQVRAGLHTGESDGLGERISCVTVELGWVVANSAAWTDAGYVTRVRHYVKNFVDLSILLPSMRLISRGGLPTTT